MKGKLITLSFNKVLNDMEISSAIELLKKEIFAGYKTDTVFYVFNKAEGSKGKMYVDMLTNSGVEEKDLIKHWGQGPINVTDIKNLNECFRCLRYMKL